METDEAKKLVESVTDSLTKIAGAEKQERKRKLAYYEVQYQNWSCRCVDP